MNSSSWAGILVGGLLPAVAFGVGGVFQKASTQAGISFGPYLVSLGLGATLAGGAFWLLDRHPHYTHTSVMYAFLIGACWTLAMGLVALGLTRYGVPLSKLAPLYNMNTLIVVLLSLWIYSEWKNVNVASLLIGAVLIVVGGILVARA